MKLPAYWHCRPPLDPDAHRAQASPHLLLFHGFMGSGKDWEAFFPELPAAYYCLAPDLPGHGLNPQDDSRFEAIFEQIHSDLLDVQSQYLVLLGYSMGGRLALMFTHWLARHRPGFVQRLILESSALGLSPEAMAARQHWDAKWANALEQNNMVSFLERWYAQPIFESLRQHAGFPELLKRRARENKPLRLARSLREAGSGQMPLQTWPEIPVLYLAGSQDPKYLALAQSLPSSIKVEILAGGHNLHFEMPQTWLASVKRFLDLR